MQTIEQSIGNLGLGVKWLDFIDDIALLISADLNPAGHAGANIQIGFAQTQDDGEGYRMSNKVTLFDRKPS